MIFRDLRDGVLVEYEVPDPEPVPEPRRLIPKPVVHNRLVALGKLEAAWAVLNSDPDILGRWLMPGHPNVYADDPGLLGVLNAIGCTEAEIEEITAPE